METYYAIAENDVIINVVVCEDPDHASSQGWLLTTDHQPWIGWTLVDGEWTPPPAEE